MSELLTRESGTFEAGEDRTVEGIAVPYNQIIDVGGYREQIAPGAIKDSGEIKLFYQHKEIIGRVIESEERKEGFWIKARISDTSTGRDAYQLLKDGALKKFSIGFAPISERDDDGVVTRTAIDLRECSIVSFPAYKNASVLSVREETEDREVENTDKEVSTMETNTEDLVELRGAVEDLERSVALLGSSFTAAQAEPECQYRSIGEFVKAVASGDEVAARAYTGHVTGDAVMKAAWIGDITQIIHKNQTIASTFSRGALPSEGLSVEWAQLKSDTTQVGVQAAEGDDLLFGKVQIETKTASVVTLGGATEFSRQAIERATVGVLDTAFEALAEKYGRAVETLARNAFNAALATSAEVEGDLTTQTGIITAVLDLVEHFDTQGRSLDGVFVSKDVYLALYGVAATDRVLQVSGSPSDKVGTLSVRTGSGEIAGLGFRLLPNADAGTFVAYDATALKVLESPGAPVRLQDENIINLTKQFSNYGYAAAFVQKPAGLVKVVEEVVSP